MRHTQWACALVLFIMMSAVRAETTPDESVPAEADATSATQADAYGQQLGTVHLPVSCNAEASQLMERGLALLHHMTYEGAEHVFAEAAQADPDCAMSYWGQAMSYIHPLWSDPPTAAEFEHAQGLVEKAKSIEQKEPWEKAYIAAVEAYYHASRSPDETANLIRFDRAWLKVHEAYPDDREAAAFYALAHLATADRGDKTFTKQKRAGALMEQVLEQHPNHPGAHHYLIHAYDVPPLAEKALEVARHYGEIAPAVPHALHMPSHIFTRLGLWQESITWNERSAEAALKHPVDGKVSLHYLHALDYLAYAYLQRAQDQKAQGVWKTMQDLEGPFQVEVVTPYAFAAVPARLALERQQWDQASQLKPRQPSDYPWDQFPAMEAITHFARAMGAVHTGDFQLAQEAIEQLTSLRDFTMGSSSYWAKQISIKRLAAMAWLAQMEDRKKEALAIMQQAAELEASTEKHPVTPGEVLPARELLADMLLMQGEPREALVAYKAALERSPNRFNSLYGAGRAAEQNDNANEAVRYYQRLVEMTADTEASSRERLQHAKAFLQQQQANE